MDIKIYLYKLGKSLNKAVEDLDAWVNTRLKLRIEREAKVKDREAKRQAELIKWQAEEK